MVNILRYDWTKQNTGKRVRLNCQHLLCFWTVVRIDSLTRAGVDDIRSEEFHGY